MKLITFYCKDGEDRLGALCKDGAALDLLAAAEAIGIQDAGVVFGSMLALIESGEPGLRAAQALVKAKTQAHLVPQGDYALRAPLPLPPQMRDFMAFEKHVVQGYEASMQMRASQSETPAEEADKLRASGHFDVPKAWYRQPLYYKCNRFAVADPEKEILWPAYSQLMDYELEIACIIGKGGKNISRENAREHIFGY